MSEEKKVFESVDAGSSDNLIGKKDADPNLADVNQGSGESVQTSTKDKKDEENETIPKKQYEDLETKLGKQGEELGELRDFMKDAGPLLAKLDESPELVKAILADKISPDLIQDALEGKVSVKEAETVTKAHDDVKKEVGEKEYEKMSPEKINKLVDDKIAEVTKTFTKKVSDSEKQREYENLTKDFVANNKDFPEYIVEINKILDEHPEITDIKTAYNIAKGNKAIEEVERMKKEDGGETAKEIAANAAGGQSQASGVEGGKDLIDELVGGRTDPNIFN